MRTDNDLYDLLCSDPELGLSQIMDQYTGLVYTIVYGKISSVGTSQDAEECVSDIFLELWRSRYNIDLSKGSLKSYLVMVARRNAIDTYRRLAAYQGHLSSLSLPDSDEDENAPPYEPVSDENIEADVIKREQSDALINAILALGKPDSEIIIRKYYLGENSKLIGKALHMKENTVNKRVGRALARLKDSIGGIL